MGFRDSSIEFRLIVVRRGVRGIKGLSVGILGGKSSLLVFRFGKYDVRVFIVGLVLFYIRFNLLF